VIRIIPIVPRNPARNVHANRAGAPAPPRFELLSVTGTITATQASEALGESPANCAFHLRTLGKYGFVREAGGGHASNMTNRAVFLTAEETEQVHREMLEIIDRYAGRQRDPSLRPAGALPVEVSVFTSPLTEFATEPRSQT
jgi:hypothetical protein